VRTGRADFAIFDPSLNLLEVAKDDSDTHLVKSKDVVAINHHEKLESGI
jgi:hypothetical protein